jgi:hypothetical protein
VYLFSNKTNRTVNYYGGNRGRRKNPIINPSIPNYKGVGKIGKGGKIP